MEASITTKSDQKSIEPELVAKKAKDPKKQIISQVQQSNSSEKLEIIHDDTFTERKKVKAKKYQCESCGKKFNSKDNLTLHLSIHIQKSHGNEIWRKKAIQIGTNLEIIWYIELTCYISSWRKKVIQIGSNSIHRMTHTTIFAVIVKHTSSTHEYCAELNQNITSVHKEKKTFCA